MADASPAEALRTRWERVIAAGAGLFNLVDSEHPLRIYVGGNASGQPTMTLMLSHRPPALSSFNLLKIETRRREDMSWILLVQLQSTAAMREFVAMCADLIESSRHAQNEERAFSLFLAGLDHWRRLFKPALGDVLSENQLRGLVAELQCMIDLLSPSIGWRETVSGWVGPLKAPQDFRVSSNRLVEVKSLHRDSRSMEISSLQQLSAGSSRLYLAAVVVEVESAASDGTVTLPDIVDEIERALIGDFTTVDLFRHRLRELGFEPENPAYSDIHFARGDASLFGVIAGFPCITNESAAPEILEASYRLSLSGIQPYKLQASDHFKDSAWN